MAEFDAGAAVAKYLLDISQPRQAAQELSRLYARLRQEAAGLGRVPAGGVGGGGRSGAGGASAAARDLDRLRDSEIRAAKAAGDHAKALRLIDAELTRAGQGTVRYNNLLAQQAQVTRGAERAGRDFGDSLKGNLLGVIGPAAAATAAFGLLSTAVRATEEAFKFEATLNADRAALGLLVSATRDQNQVLQEADTFAARYAFTQREITDALSESVFVLRASKRPTEDVLANLARLAVLNPKEGIQGAAFALGELVSGDVVSLVERFRLGKEEAYAMRDAIKAGQDPIVVLGKYLDDAGISMDLLAQRTQGAQGKMRELAVEQERTQRALAGQSGGLGLAILEKRIELERGLANLLGGRVLEGLRETGRANFAAAESQQAYSDALARGATEAEARAAAENRYREVVEQTRSIQEVLAPAIQAAADAANAAAPAQAGLGDAHRNAALGAREQADAERQLAGALADQRAGERSGGDPRSAVEQARDARLARERAARTRAENQAQRAANAQALADQRAGERGGGDSRSATEQTRDANLARERQRRFEQERERLANERLRTAKSHTSELNTQLGLEERIYDSQRKQYQAAIDFQLAINDDAKQDILDADKARRLRNTIGNARDPRIRALAQLELDRLPLENARRESEIAEKSATAGGQLINGRVFQSLAGGGPGAPAGGATGGGPASAGQAPTAAAGAGSLTVINQLVVDGKVLAEAMDPYFAERLLAAWTGSQNSGGGQVRA
jgi:hypothetical protein